MGTTSVNKVITPLALVFLAAAVAQADDAAIKRELLGRKRISFYSVEEELV